MNLGLETLSDVASRELASCRHQTAAFVEETADGSAVISWVCRISGECLSRGILGPFLSSEEKQDYEYRDAVEDAAPVFGHVLSP